MINSATAPRPSLRLLIGLGASTSCSVKLEDATPPPLSIQAPYQRRIGIAEHDRGTGGGPIVGCIAQPFLIIVSEAARRIRRKSVVVRRVAIHEIARLRPHNLCKISQSESRLRQRFADRPQIGFVADDGIAVTTFRNVEAA